MAKNVAEALWEMLAAAGVKRCYGIVGDALNPVIDALRRNGSGPGTSCTSGTRNTGSSPPWPTPA